MSSSSPATPGAKPGGPALGASAGVGGPPPVGSAPVVPSVGAGSTDDSKGNKLQSVDAIFTMFSQVLGSVTIILLLPCLLLALLDIYRLRKSIKAETTRIENGEKVLVKDSVLYKVLRYAEIKDENTREEFSIYIYLALAKAIFVIANIAIVILFANFAIKIALAVEGNDIGTADGDARFLKGFMLSMFSAIIMVLYVKFIYKRIFEDNIFKEIQRRYNALVALDNTIYNFMISPPTNTEITDTATAFYGYLQSDDINNIMKNLAGITRQDDVIKQVMTLNLYEYFKKNVPNFNSSEIKTQLFTLAGVTTRTVRPSQYLRIDCTNPIANMYHVLDLESKIASNIKEDVESDISTNMANLNQEIARVKLEAQPAVSLIRNYMKTSASYFLFVDVIAVLLVMKLFNIKYEGSFVQTVANKLTEKIKNLFKRKSI